MGLFGGSMPRMGGAGLMETPEQRMERERLEGMFGRDPGGVGSSQPSIDDTASMPVEQQSAPQGFWQGGNKFGVKDGIAGLLAVLGDTFSQRAGGQGGAVQNLTGSRNSAMELVKKAQERKAEMEAARQRATAAGLSGPQADMLAHNDAKYGDFKPPNNDTAADYDFWKSRMTPEQFASYVQNKAEPPQFRQGPDGQFYRIDTQAPPQITEDDWNSAPAMGGPTPPASGGFPRFRR